MRAKMILEIMITTVEVAMLEPELTVVLFCPEKGFIPKDTTKNKQSSFIGAIDKLYFFK
jgi:hypothetical protein